MRKINIIIFCFVAFLFISSCSNTNDKNDPLLQKSRALQKSNRNIIPRNIKVEKTRHNRFFFKKTILKEEYYFETFESNNQIEVKFIEGKIDNKKIDSNHKNIEDEIKSIKKMLEEKEDDFLNDDDNKYNVVVKKTKSFETIDDNKCIKFKYKYNQKMDDLPELKITGYCWINEKNGLPIQSYDKSKLTGKLFSLLPVRSMADTWFFYNKELKHEKTIFDGKIIINFLIYKSKISFKMILDEPYEIGK